MSRDNRMTDGWRRCVSAAPTQTCKGRKPDRKCCAWIGKSTRLGFETDKWAKRDTDWQRGQTLVRYEAVLSCWYSPQTGDAKSNLASLVHQRQPRSLSVWHQSSISKCVFRSSASICALLNSFFCCRLARFRSLNFSAAKTLVIALQRETL